MCVRFSSQEPGQGASPADLPDEETWPDSFDVITDTSNVAMGTEGFPKECRDVEDNGNSCRKRGLAGER